MPNFSIKSVPIAKQPTQTDWDEIAKLGKMGSKKKVLLKTNGNAFRAYVQGKFSLTRTKVKAALGDRHAQAVLVSRSTNNLERAHEALVQRYGAHEAMSVLFQALGNRELSSLSRGDIAQINEEIESRRLSTKPEEWTAFLKKAESISENPSDAKNYLTQIAEAVNKLPRSATREDRARAALYAFYHTSISSRWRALTVSEPLFFKEYIEANYEKQTKVDAAKHMKLFDSRDWISFVPVSEKVDPNGLPKTRPADDIGFGGDDGRLPRPENT